MLRTRFFLFLRLTAIPLLIISAIPLSSRVSVPTNISDVASALGFSTSAAFARVKLIAERPHRIGSAANREVREEIVKQLRESGFVVEVQRKEVISRIADGTNIGTVENIIGIRKGVGHNDKALMLQAHYDSYGHSLGAADDGAGVASILEATHSLVSKPVANDVVVLFTDGEEAGLLGAQAFVYKHSFAKRIGLVLNFEARGTGGPVLMFETSGAKARLIKLFASAAPVPIADSLFDVIYRYMPNSTDLSVIKSAGIPGMNFAFVEGAEHYHTAGDTAAHLDRSSLSHEGSYLAALIQSYGNVGLPLAATAEPGYFNLSGQVLVSYPYWSAYVVLLLAFGFFILLLLRMRGAGSLRRHLLNGLAFSAITLLATWVVVGLAHTLILSTIGEAGMLGLPGWLLLTYAMLAVAVYLALAGWVQRGLGIYGIIVLTVLTLSVGILGDIPLPLAAMLAVLMAFLLMALRTAIGPTSIKLGGLATWLILGAVSTYISADIAHLFLLPALLLFMLETAGLWWIKAEDLRNAIVGLISLLMGVAWFAYYAHLFQLGVGMQMPAAAVVPFSLLLIVAAPVFQTVRSIPIYLEPAVYAGGGAALILWAVLTTPEGHLRSRELFYVHDFDANKSYWATSKSTPDPWGRRMIGSSQERLSIANLFPTRSGAYLVADAPKQISAEPRLDILKDDMVNGQRHLTMRLLPGLEGSEMQWFIGAPDKIVSAALDGHSIEVQNGRNGWWRWIYHGMPKQGVLIDLTLTANTLFRSRLTEIQQPWPIALRELVPPPPEATRPNSRGYGETMLVTRAYRDEQPRINVKTD